MTRRLLKLMSITALVAAAAMPAKAGPSIVGYNTVRGVTVSGPVQVPKTGTGTGAVTFFELEGGAMNAGLQILPLPTAPDPTTLQPTPATVGCIVFVVGGKRDQGCSIVSHYVDVDPLMQSGAFTFAVESETFEGSELRATLLLTGDGVPSPGVTQTDTSLLDDPPYGTIALEAVLSRTATTVGTIVSDGMGLGTSQGVVGGTFREPTAVMFSGVGARFIHSPGCILQVGVNCMVE